MGTTKMGDFKRVAGEAGDESERVLATTLCTRRRFCVYCTPTARAALFSATASGSVQAHEHNRCCCSLLCLFPRTSKFSLGLRLIHTDDRALGGERESSVVCRVCARGGVHCRGAEYKCEVRT